MTEKPQSAELHPGPGFRIKELFDRPPESVIDEFRQYKTPDVSDLLNRLYTMSPAIKNVVDNVSIVGPACTVKVYPGDNLMVHKALDVAQPGDIIVVDAGGANSNAVIGDLIAQKAKHRGITGFVIDGLVRDLPDMRGVGLPVFAIGITPVGPLHRGPGEINHAVSCGGIVVNPGDVIVADECGVVVVRRDFAEETLKRLSDKQESLKEYVANVRRGKFSNEWVDRILSNANCVVTE